MADYSKLNDTITQKVIKAMKLINNPEIDPEIRQLNQEILFREVGSAVYNKVYDMNAYDYEISGTKGPGIDDRHFGMAKTASASVATGNLGIDQRVRTFLDGTTAKAQLDATRNANQSGKRTKVTRKMNGETCEWCESLAGTYEKPDSEVFRRHRDCDCSLSTEGYKSRNGLLKNYNSAPENKSVLAQGGLRTENAAQTAMENALNAGNPAKAQQIVDGVQDPDLKKGLQSTLDALSGKKSRARVDPATGKIVIG